MQATESVPLFRTRQAAPVVAAKEAPVPTQPAPVATPDALAFTLADVDALPIEPVAPMRVVDARPPLPLALWLAGLTPAEALAHHRRLVGDYYCSCGADSTGWFVRCDPQHYGVRSA